MLNDSANGFCLVNICKHARGMIGHLVGAGGGGCKFVLPLLPRAAICCAFLSRTSANKLTSGQGRSQDSIGDEGKE